MWDCFEPEQFSSIPLSSVRFASSNRIGSVASRRAAREIGNWWIWIRLPSYRPLMCEEISWRSRLGVRRDEEKTWYREREIELFNALLITNYFYFFFTWAYRMAERLEATYRANHNSHRQDKTSVASWSKCFEFLEVNDCNWSETFEIWFACYLAV